MTTKGKTQNGKFKRYGNLLLLTLPAVILAFVFCYIPMSGLIMAFKEEIDLTEYDTAVQSIMTPWSGFAQFEKLFAADSDFMRILGNTLYISVLKILLVFPIPILLAIMITEVQSRPASKAIQSIIYLPHFLSWAIVASVFETFMHPNVGALNTMLHAMGLGTVNLSDAKQFPWLMVLTTAWKDIGWSAVAYISAVLAIDQEQFEAARIDGAGKVKQIFYITLPGIAGTVAVLFIMRIGYLMDAGFEQIYAMLTPTAESTGEIIGTYIYKLAIKNGGSYALTTAAGLFNSVVGLILVVGGNLFCKKVFKRSIW